MARTSSYREALLESLKDPLEAAAYLDAAMEDSQEAFLKASKNVAQSLGIPMSEVASMAGVQRETLYRSLSGDGNPTLKTLRSILTTFGLRLKVEVISDESQTAEPKPSEASESKASEASSKKTPSELQLLDQLILGGFLRAGSCDSPVASINQTKSNKTEESLSLAGVGVGAA